MVSSIFQWEFLETDEFIQWHVNHLCCTLLFALLFFLNHICDTQEKKVDYSCTTQFLA